jgi:hypothetical protein
MIAQSDTGAAPIGIDEVDPRGLKRNSSDLKSGPTGFMAPGLELADRHHPNRCSVRKVLLAPIKEAAGRPALFWRDHHQEAVPQMIDSINCIEFRLTDV